MKPAAMIVLLGFVAPVLADNREEKVTRYVKDLESKDAQTRATAAIEIGNIAAIKAAYGKPALDALLKALKDKDAKVRAAAAEALGKLDEPKKTVEPLVELLKNDKSVTVKTGAATGLGLIGEPAKSAVKTLREVGEKARADKDNRLAQACRQAVQNINGGQRKN